jgi:malonyl-CoA decarboxylase
MKSYDWLDALVRQVAGKGLGLVRRHAAPAEPSMARASAKDLTGLCDDLLSESGEAFGTALAHEVVQRFEQLDAAGRALFFRELAKAFGPERDGVRSAYDDWISSPTATSRSTLMAAIEGRRQRLFRRMNMAPNGTGALVRMRSSLLGAIEQDHSLLEVDHDLRHLLSSWFNRGFFEFQTIGWETPADILEKLIAYESVHEVNGWDDLRRRLAPDRRCYAFFHPALPREPLIFVEVALQRGLSNAVGPILKSPVGPIAEADTAIFYSISNCQKGLRGINFGNFLIKQVVDELRRELPQLKRFSTLSPIPGFRKWLTAIGADKIHAALGERMEQLLTLADSRDVILAREFLIEAADEESPDQAVADILLRSCAYFLSTMPEAYADAVAKFHIGNGARLERINPAADDSAKGRMQSFGLMVNYLYEPEQIVGNHQNFASRRRVQTSPEIARLLADHPAETAHSLAN